MQRQREQARRILLETWVAGAQRILAQRGDNFVVECIRHVESRRRGLVQQSEQRVGLVRQRFGNEEFDAKTSCSPEI